MNKVIDRITSNLYEIIAALEELKIVKNIQNPSEIITASETGNVEKVLTVDQFILKYKCFTKGGIRSYIFFEDTNGLKKSAAIIRIGRKILIDEEKFFNWIRNAPSSS